MSIISAKEPILQEFTCICGKVDESYLWCCRWSFWRNAIKLIYLLWTTLVVPQCMNKVGIYCSWSIVLYQSRVHSLLTLWDQTVYESKSTPLTLRHKTWTVQYVVSCESSNNGIAWRHSLSAGEKHKPNKQWHHPFFLKLIFWEGSWQVPLGPAVSKLLRTDWNDGQRRNAESACRVTLVWSTHTRREKGGGAHLILLSARSNTKLHV